MHMFIRTHIHTYMYIHTYSELAAAKKVSDDQETIEKFFLEYLHQLQVSKQQYSIILCITLLHLLDFTSLTMQAGGMRVTQAQHG